MPTPPVTYMIRRKLLAASQGMRTDFAQSTSVASAPDPAQATTTGAWTDFGNSYLSDNFGNYMPGQLFVQPPKAPEPSQSTSTAD